MENITIGQFKDLCYSCEVEIKKVYIEDGHIKTSIEYSGPSYGVPCEYMDKNIRDIGTYIKEEFQGYTSVIELTYSEDIFN